MTQAPTVTLLENNEGWIVLHLQHTGFICNDEHMVLFASYDGRFWFDPRIGPMSSDDQWQKLGKPQDHGPWNVKYIRFRKVQENEH